MSDVTRRVATEQIIQKVDGLNIVIAEVGDVVPLAYDDLVPDSKTEPLVAGNRNTSARRLAHAEAEAEAAKDKPAAKRTASKKATEDDA